MPPRYLYVGTADPFGTCEARRRSLTNCGRSVTAVGYERYLAHRGSAFARLEVRTGLSPGVWRLNAAVLRLARESQPAVIWVAKGTLLWPRLLERLRRAADALLVHYNTDDLANPRNLWLNVRRTIPLYDVQITTNIPNAAELPGMGARCVIPSQLGYDADLFCPRELTREDERAFGADVSFIGHWEPGTEELLDYATRVGLPLRLRGHNWRHATSRPLTRARPVYGSAYVKAICGAKVSLGIVSAWNRNQTAGRTYEIPACRAFLLAPRTEEIQQCFREGTEVECFGDAREMVDKARFYLERESARQRIAQAGYERCTKSGYSWADRMTALVRQVERMIA